MIALQCLALLSGLILAIKGADFLVQGASSIAHRYQVSDFVIGLTVVSFGTSLPELVIAIAASNQGAPDLIIGNIIGSNIANILLVLGTAAMIYPLTATNNTVWKEIPFTLFASLVLLFILNDQLLDPDAKAELSRSDGVILLLCFGAFVYYVAQLVKSDGAIEREWVGEHSEHRMRRAVLEIIGGIVALTIGARLTVGGASALADSWGLSEGLIGLTFIAIGTSLPELVTSAVAAYRKNVDIAVGNVVGSNIFNIFIVLGITSVIRDIPFAHKYNTDLLLMVGATILLFVCMFIGHPKRTIQRWEGFGLLAIYAGYMTYLGMRG